MKLTIVGMSGSGPSAGSPASSYLLQAEDPDGRLWSVVLDLGNGSLGALQRSIDPFDVDLYALSHMHPDHCADVSGLYVLLRYHPVRGAERNPGLAPSTVYGPPGADRRIAEMYGLEDGETMSDRLDVRCWETGRVVSVGPFDIEPFPVEHPVPAFGFRITGPSTLVPGTRAVLAYTGDTDTCDALEDLARDADLLLAEAAFVEGRDTARGIHLTGLRAGAAATRAGARRLLLTHVPGWNDPALTRAEAESSFAGPIDVAEPGAVHLV
jgi:ribonuclease BN (tRNA processing enzyme)